MRAKPRSTMREPARESRPATREYFQPRQYNHARWLNPRLPQPSQECHRSGYEYASEVAGFPPSRLNGYSGHRSYSERTNVAPVLTNIGRGEYVETNRNPNDGNERFRAHRSQYDNERVGDTVDRNYNTHRACQRKESHRPISTNSTSISFSREVGGAFFNESVPGNAEETIGQPLQQQQNVPTRVSTELPPEVASRPSRVMTPARFTRDSEVADMEQIVSSDTDVKCEPIFSFHDLFLQHLLSMFIQYLPGQLEPVMNFTKKPRKMRWYIKYTTKIEHVCEPYVHLQWESKRVVVMVENRVLLKMKGPSTVTLLQNVIKTMRDHALSWRNFKSEVEQSLELYRRRRGDEVDLSNVFLRAWNNLKDRTGGISLPRWSNYFCGSRLHHWNFIFGKVEIGSGSHEEKRKAFRLAAASAAEFLLGLDDGRNEHRWRPPPRDNNSDTSDDCELLFVRDVNDESVAIAATAAAVTLNDSPEFATDDTSGGEAALAAVKSQNGQSGNDAGQVKSSTGSQVDELAIIVISSDSDTEDGDISEGDGTLAVETPPASSTTGPPSSEPSSEVASTRQCDLCEIIRMRKPDSAGCRQCQLANKPTNINWSTSSNEAVETKVATSDEDAIRAAAGCVGSSETRPSSTNNRPQSTSADTEEASRPAKRLRRLFELFRKSE